MNIRHFTHLYRQTPDEINALVALAQRLKAGSDPGSPLAGKSVGLCFLNPSLRTMVSFSTAAAQLGGHPIVLHPGGGGTWTFEFEDGGVMDGIPAEHAKEAVRVLSRYCSVLAIRSFPEGKDWDEDRKEKALNAFREHATVPVINMESTLGHPCQALADLMTIRERMNPLGKKFVLTWAPHKSALPLAVPHSAAEIASMAGMDVVIARPRGYDLDQALIDRVKSHCAANSRRLTVTDDPEAAVEGAHVVYAKSWGSLRDYGTPPSADPAFRAKWIVDEDKMARTDNGIFMHCLPVRRNLVVTDGVLDGPASAAIDQAENRLHTAKALLIDLTRGQAAAATPQALERNLAHA